MKYSAPQQTVFVVLKHDLTTGVHTVVSTYATADKANARVVKERSFYHRNVVKFTIAVQAVVA